MQTKREESFKKPSCSFSDGSGFAPEHGRHGFYWKWSQHQPQYLFWRNFEEGAATHLCNEMKLNICKCLQVEVDRNATTYGCPTHPNSVQSVTRCCNSKASDVSCSLSHSVLSFCRTRIQIVSSVQCVVWLRSWKFSNIRMVSNAHKPRAFESEYIRKMRCFWIHEYIRKTRFLETRIFEWNTGFTEKGNTRTGYLRTTFERPLTRIW